MEEETDTREPTSGDRLRRYNSTTTSLLRRRETGKADLAGEVQLARMEEQVSLWRTVSVYVCTHVVNWGQGHHCITLVQQQYLQWWQNLCCVASDQIYNLKACVLSYRFWDAGLRWDLSPRSCTAPHSKILLWTPCLHPPSPWLVSLAPPPLSPASRPPDPGACRTSHPCSWTPDSRWTAAVAALRLPGGEELWRRAGSDIPTDVIKMCSFMCSKAGIRTQRVCNDPAFIIGPATCTRETHTL